MLESEETRDGVDEQRENNGVKAEGEHAVEQSQATQSARRYLHIGNLAGHPDDKGEVSKIEIIRRTLPGKFQTSGMSVFARFVAVTVKDVSVMQSENRMDEHP